MQIVLLLIIALALASCGGDDAPSGADEVILATTTSTVDSGLLDVLVPMFEEETGYDVKEIGVGSGAALELASKGEADVALVHSPEAEEELVATGKTGRRLLVMHNRFAIVGPGEDPAGVAEASGVEDAMQRIAEGDGGFVSRGDESGTHTFELGLWEQAGIDPGGAWYEETGQGMGATLQVAAERGAYTISDRGTYLATRDATGLASLYDRGPEFLNVYHVIEVAASAGGRVNTGGGTAFADFMVSDEVQALIEDFGVDEFGEPLFVPDAGKDEEELAEAA